MSQEDIDNDMDKAVDPEEVSQSIPDDTDNEDDNDNIEAKAKDSEKHIHEVRRAIEDHIDRNRLQKEIDYLFDDDFEEKD